MWFLIFILLAPVTPKLDLYISGLFYEPSRGFYNDRFFRFLFDYGELFGLATGFAAGFLLLLSFKVSSFKILRRGLLALLITLVLGAGLITNAGFKEFWGRPRPKQVVEFGGDHPYRPFWQPNFHAYDPQKSFPSGHVAMGFYFLSLCLVAKRHHSKLLFYIGLFLSLFLGGGLMIARVVQGGHFLSDVVAALLLMWYVARLADWLCFRNFRPQIPLDPPRASHLH